MTTPDRFDFIVLGDGAAGVAAAQAAAELGARTALVRHGQRPDLGRAAWLPLLRAARAAFDARDAARFGVRAEKLAVDFPAVLDRARRARAALEASRSSERLASFGVRTFPGPARFLRKDRVAAGNATLRFRKAVLVPALRPASIEAPGLEALGVLTLESLFELTALPKRLAVLGGGPEGCELAQALARLGGEVALLQEGPRLLEREDAQAAAWVRDALARDGVRVLLSTRVLRAAADGAEKVLSLSTEGKEDALRVDAVLSADRAPDIAGLDLPRAGIESDAGKGVTVDEFLQTTNSKIYAAGEGLSSWDLAQAPAAAARIVANNALLFGNLRASAAPLAACVFTDPEVARMGLDEARAAEQGYETRTVSRPFSHADRALADGDEGFLKLIVEKGGDRLLGATLVARHASEMAGGLALALCAELGPRALAEAPHPYPALADTVQRLAQEYNAARVSPSIKTLLKTLVQVAA